MSQLLAAQRFKTLLYEVGLPSHSDDIKKLQGLDLSGCANFKAIAQILLKHQILTRYQAERLLSGRTRGFFYDHYEIRELLGYGGMGLLYLARDKRDGRTVALKVLHEQFRENAGMLERLKMEALAGQRLNHERILKTIDFRDSGAVHYLVMEYIHGINLLELLKLKGPLPPEIVAHYIIQAAEGLSYAHRNGLVHRDVKPDNLLLNSDGNIKVLDFGLSLVEEFSDKEFSLSMIFGHDNVGALDYMSPEQIRDSHTVDERTDIFSLGCTFYQLVSGKIPYPGKTRKEKIRNRFKEIPQRLNRLIPGFDRTFEYIIFKMLAGPLDIRFQSMDEVIEALQPLARNERLEIDMDQVLEKRMESAQQREMRQTQQKPTKDSEPGEESKKIAHGELGHLTGLTIKHNDTEPTIPTDYRTWNKDARADESGERQKLPRRSTPRMAILVSQEDGSRIALSEEVLSLGRADDSDIRINKPGISKRHAEFSNEGDWWAIRDCNSSNGTAVNGKRITGQMLWPGDTITFAGRYHYRILDPKQISTKPPGKMWNRLMLVALFCLIAIILGFFRFLF